jgi:uncharacterized membrane protein YkoI
MLKKEVLIGTGIVAVLTVGGIIGGLTLGPVSASQTLNTSPTSQTAIQSIDDDDDAAEAAVKGSDTDSVEEQVGDQTEGVSDAEEATAMQVEATISAADAEAAALAGNPDTSVIKTELDNEDGVLAYSVELSNGSEVKVDAGTGEVLHTEAGDQDGENGEQETAED